MVKGVKATFVIGINEREQTIISARSLGTVNVQAIMEKFGGGGHFTSAAAQVNEPIEIVEEKLQKIVKDYMTSEN
jgi:c-di-AMP phosphodiesterase-like protein